MSLPSPWNHNIVKHHHHHHHHHKSVVFKINSIVPSSRLLIRNAQKSSEECYNNSLFPPANQSVAAIVFGDGSPTTLYPLTKRRSEAAIPIAGNYRLIDAVVSNCINSNVSKIYALTQFNSTSLNSHLSRAYSGVFLGKDGFVEVLAACQTPEDKGGWFQGTADAIRKCLWVLEQYPVLEFLILPGHHLYKMNYQKLIEAHRDNSADITAAVHSSSRNQDPGFGSFRIDSKNRVVEFVDEPQNNHVKSSTSSEQNSDRFNGIDDHTTTFPSMGIYVINRDVMTKLLKEYFPTANDLRCEVVPQAISMGMNFDGYWGDMRSIESFYNANMESTKKAKNTHNFYDRDSPIFTLPRNLPPTLITDAVITDSIVGDGCVLDRCKIKGTVVGMRTRVGEGAIVEDSVIMGSDTYPRISGGVERNDAMYIPIGIGKDTYIRKAIVDKNARIGKNVKIINKDNVVEGNKEADGYVITGGIIVVIRSAVISDGSIL